MTRGHLGDLVFDARGKDDKADVGFAVAGDLGRRVERSFLVFVAQNDSTALVRCGKDDEERPDHSFLRNVFLRALKNEPLPTCVSVDLQDSKAHHAPYTLSLSSLHMNLGLTSDPLLRRSAVRCSESLKSSKSS